MNLGVLFSSGKDSMLALTLAKEQKHSIKCLITIQSRNPDSYMYHTPNTSLTKLQAEALNLPLLTITTRGIKEKELKELKTILKKAKEKYKIQGVVTGALYSEYQKGRIEKICRKLNLTACSPLWHMNQEDELKLLLKKRIRFILTHIAAEGLDKSWLNKPIQERHIRKLKKIRGINPAGEGGEYESLVINSPLFSKRLIINSSKIIEHSENNAALIITNAKLQQQ